MTKLSRLTPAQAATVREQQLKNVLRKVAAGRTPTSREQAILDAASAGPTESKARKEQDEEAVWLSPAEFIRWLPSQGLTLSRKNLYARYYGKRARHPVHVSPDGRRIHKWKAAELIKLIQAKDDTEGDHAIRERQKAEALAKTAQAVRQVLAVETSLGLRIRTDVVAKTWSQAVENVKNELRTVEQNGTDDIVRAVAETVALPEEENVKLRSRVREILKKAHHAALKHLSVTYANAPQNAGAAQSAA